MTSRMSVSKAILEFNKVEQIKSDYPALYKYRGYANFNSNDMKATIADLDKALIKDPSNAVSLAIRGVAKSKTGDKNGGCEDLHRAMELGLSQAAREIERYCK